MSRSTNRREFLQNSLGAVAGLGLMGAGSKAWAVQQEPLYKISLAQWSLVGEFRNGTRDNLDFSRDAKNEFGIEAVEYVNQFFMDKGEDATYIGEMKKRADDNGVKSLLIMVDGEGNLGDSDDARRATAVENHYKWVASAKILGCHSIRVNAASNGRLSLEEQQKLAADGLRRLSEHAAQSEMNVIVENHGGSSSNGEWLAGTIKMVDLPNCGTLPDFGNFRIGGGEEYDRYKGIAELMPFAKGVSAKSYDFDEAGNETTMDFMRIMKIVVDAGYHGHVGVEYEGRRLSPSDGVKATKALLEKCRDALSANA